METVTDALPVPTDSDQPLVLLFSAFVVAAQIVDDVPSFPGQSFNVFAGPSFSAIDNVTFSARPSDGVEASLHLPRTVLTRSNGSNTSRLSYVSYLDESLFIQRGVPVGNRTNGLLGSLVIAAKVENEMIFEDDNSSVSLLFTINTVSRLNC